MATTRKSASTPYQDAKTRTLVQIVCVALKFNLDRSWLPTLVWVADLRRYFSSVRSRMINKTEVL